MTGCDEMTVGATGDIHWIPACFDSDWVLDSWHHTRQGWSVLFWCTLPQGRGTIGSSEVVYPQDNHLEDLK